MFARGVKKRVIPFVRSLFIQTQSTPNENALKFVPSGISVLPKGSGGTIEISSMKEAISKSDLAMKLLSVNDRAISSILFGSDFITIVKNSENWSILKPQIFAVLTEHLTMGQEIFKSEFIRKLREENEVDKEIDENEEISAEEEVVLLIKELLTTRIQPAIQEDGGDIQFIRFDIEEGIVYLKLIGACKSCSSSEITLKSGIEDMLKYYIDEVKGVKQVFDVDEEKEVEVDREVKVEREVKMEREKSENGELPPLL